MLWSIDSCHKGHSLTSVTWAQVYIVLVIDVTCFFYVICGPVFGFNCLQVQVHIEKAI